MARLENDQIFPTIEVPAVGGGVIRLPDELNGSYGVVLIYRGNWCPFCNEQMAAFVAAKEALQENGIKVVAFSVDDETATRDFIAKHDISFAVGHSADIEMIVDVTGSYRNEAPTHGEFLENTGFVLAPDGRVLNAVYSSRAIGRLVPGDVVRLVAFMKSIMK